MKFKEKIKNKNNYVISIIGMRGYGKSYLTQRMLEEEYMEDADKIFILDVVGIYKDVADATILVDRVTTTNNFYVFMHKVMKSRDKVINFNISMLHRKDMKEFINQLSDYLILKKPVNTIVGIIADEVGEYMSQGLEVYAERFESLIRIGRNKNILYIVMTTQRPQKVNKHILALSDYYIIFRVMHNLDLEAVKNVLGFNSKEFANYQSYIKTQGVGYFCVYDGQTFEQYNDLQETLINKDDNKQKQKYDAKTKQEALEYHNKGKSIAAISKLMNINYNTVKSWIYAKEGKLKQTYKSIKKEDKNE